MKRYKALVDMSLRQSSDPKSPKYNEWHNWNAGEIFTPPEHMDIEKALQRRIIKEVKVDGQAKRTRR